METRSYNKVILVLSSLLPMGQTGGEEESRGVATCDECEKIFTVLEKSNGWFAAGGKGCHECGCEEFTLLEPEDLGL